MSHVCVFVVAALSAREIKMCTLISVMRRRDMSSMRQMLNRLALNAFIIVVVVVCAMCAVLCAV